MCGADSKTDAKLLNATLAQKLATECADILKERAAINRNVPYQEDLEMLRQCFGPLLEGITEPMIPAERPEANTQAHIMLRAKGAFCAEWPEEQYTLYQCNLTKNSSQCLGGTLLDFQFAPENLTFDDRTREYQTCRVHPEDAANYLTLMNRARMLAESRTHECTHSLEYRELVGETHRWVRLSMYIEKRVKGADVILHLLFQNIDREKRETLRQQERSEEDALTGALSHRAFLLQANQLLSEKKEHVQHAFLLVEIKGFQEVSHTFGMEIGNSLLCDLVRSFRTMMRSEDLLGRIGLNRFLICLKDVPNDEVIRSRAKQLVRMVFGEYDNGITTTGSIGIAVFPRDGDSVDLLYSKLDAALTQVGTGGGEGFRFYQNQRVARHSAEHLMQLTFPELDASDIPSQSNATNRTRILVVDASEQNRSLLTAQLEDEYAVFQAENSRVALQLLRRYSQSISVVLLDLDLPGMSGLELLQTMQASTELGSIPVLILSGADAAEHAYHALELGAMDYLPKPADSRLLRLRVRNAVNRRKSEHILLQNHLLQMQSEAEARYRFIIQNTGTIAIEYDWKNEIFTYDRMISKHIAGIYDHRPFWRILQSDLVATTVDVKAMQRMVQNLIQNPNETASTMKVRLTTVNWEKHWFRMKCLKMTDAAKPCCRLLITLNDINVDVDAEEHLRYLANYDPLTRIYNRTAFLEKASEVLRNSAPNKWVVSVADIDNFRDFNRLYGHSEGDHLLSFVASQLHDTIHEIGGVCGRLHTDNFVLLQPARKDYMDQVTQARIQAFSKFACNWTGQVSIGRCIVNTPSMKIEELLDRALLALRKAKQGPAKDIWYDDSMHQIQLRNRQIVSEMEQALKEEQFVLYFQPIYDVLTHAVLNAEVLVRWNHPKRGLLPPAEFIPLLEDNGFIRHLDRFVWDRTCRALRDWLREGREVVPISVNLSCVDLTDQSLLDDFLVVTKRYDIPTHLLRLEMTENAYLHGGDQSIAALNRLRNAGFLIEIDNFGNGVGSLSMLSALPADVLKLDIRHLHTATLPERNQPITELIVRMADNAQLTLIAEGVETQEQAESLRAMGCRNMQGFFFQEPVPAKQFAQYLPLCKEQNKETGE